MADMKKLVGSLLPALLALALLTGCKESTVPHPGAVEIDLPPLHSASATAVDTCHATAAQLRTWLSTLDREGPVSAEIVPSKTDQDRYVDRAWGSFPLVQTNSAPEPLPMVAMLTLEHRSARFADRNGSVDDPKALELVLKDVDASSLSGGFGFGRPGYSYVVRPINVLIGRDEQWGDVVKLMDAVIKGEFAQAYFVFEAKTELAPPTPPAAAKHMQSVAMDGEEMPWKREWNASQELAQLTTKCPAIATPFATKIQTNHDSDAQWKEFITKTAEAFEACGCDTDAELIKTFAWTRQGRPWGRVTTNAEVELRSAYANAPPPEIISAPKSMVWSEAYTRVVRASHVDASVREVYVRFAISD